MGHGSGAGSLGRAVTSYTTLKVHGSNPITNINKIIFYLSNCNVEDKGKRPLMANPYIIFFFILLCTIVMAPPLYSLAL